MIQDGIIITDEQNGLPLVVVTRSTWLIVVDFSFGEMRAAADELPREETFRGGNRSIREEGKRRVKSLGLLS